MPEETHSHTPGPHKLPGRYQQFQKRFPKIAESFEQLGAATAGAGPLQDKTRALVKLAIAVGGEMEGAVHSHTRRAIEAGCSADEIRHVVLLALTTIGFPSTMKTMSWVEDILEQAK